MRIRRALISVSDKRGVVEFARALADLDVEILSTGGTANEIRQGGVPVRRVEDETGVPEMLEGRVKTLHPRIHAAILARRDRADDMAALAAMEIRPIDLVVVNLYPFADRLAEVRGKVEEALEEIDIGGPAMLRAAAKNHPSVAVVCDPGDYEGVLGEMRETGGSLADQTRSRLAGLAFALTADYDLRIAAAFAARKSEAREIPEFPPRIGPFVRSRVLRYGENPHQRAALYSDETWEGASLATARVLGGKETSYNNYLDLEAALATASEFDEPAAVVVKHTNPCGAAIASDPATAFERAWFADEKSAYGSVVALNRAVDGAVAERMARSTASFIEAIVAPAFDQDAARVLAGRKGWGKSVRLVECANPPRRRALGVRSVRGGLLVQDADHDLANPDLDRPEGWEVVSGEAAAVESARRDLVFAMAVAKHVLSNAIVLADRGATVGIGGGQTSRVDAVEIAIARAADRAKGSVLASDAFFPFADSIERAARAGVRAVIQPGGSRRDDEVVQAAREFGIAMVFTRTRHFRH